MKRQEPLSVGEIIRQAIENTGRNDDYDRQRACYLWQEIVGPNINRYTTRRWVERDVLHVCITSAPLKNELSFHIPVLVAKLNEAVGRQILTTIIIH